MKKKLYFNVLLLNLLLFSCSNSSVVPSSYSKYFDKNNIDTFEVLFKNQSKEIIYVRYINRPFPLLSSVCINGVKLAYDQNGAIYVLNNNEMKFIVNSYLDIEVTMEELLATKNNLDSLNIKSTESFYYHNIVLEEKSQVEFDESIINETSFNNTFEITIDKNFVDHIFTINDFSSSYINSLNYLENDGNNKKLLLQSSLDKSLSKLVYNYLMSLDFVKSCSAK